MSIAVTFDPFGVTLTGEPGESLFEVARRYNLPVPTACVGRGTCGLCRVKVLEGEAALSPLNSTEKRHLGTNYFITKLRLSCQTRLCEVPAGSAVVVQVPDAVARLKAGAALPSGPSGSTGPRPGGLNSLNKKP